MVIPADSLPSSVRSPAHKWPPAYPMIAAPASTLTASPCLAPLPPCRLTPYLFRACLITAPLRSCIVRAANRLTVPLLAVRAAYTRCARFGCLAGWMVGCCDGGRLLLVVGLLRADRPLIKGARSVLTASHFRAWRCDVSPTLGRSGLAADLQAVCRRRPAGFSRAFHNGRFESPTGPRWAVASSCRDCRFPVLIQCQTTATTADDRLARSRLYACLFIKTP